MLMRQNKRSGNLYTVEKSVWNQSLHHLLVITGNSLIHLQFEIIAFL